jgi:hypothetical protein
MCVSCGCWMDLSQKMGGDGNHPEDSTKMPNVNTEVSPLAKPSKG